MAISGRSTGAGSGVYSGQSFVDFPQAVIDVYSEDILYEALGIMMFREFVVEKAELGKQPGDTIVFTRYNQIDRGGRLDEKVSLSGKAMAGSQTSLTVTEWGNAIEVSEFLLQTSFDDQMDNAATLLGRDYAVVNDLMCRDAVLTGSNVLFGGGKVSRAALVAPGNANPDYFDVEVIRSAVEILQTNNTPKFNGDFYVAFIHPHQAAYLKRDPDWVAAQNYAQTRRLFTGEIGRWEDVVFIATTHMNNGAAAASAPAYEAALVAAAVGGAVAGNVYRSAIFGDAAVGVGTGLPVEMRDDGVTDFGRKHGLAWYSIEEAAVLDDDFIVTIETV